MNTTLAMCAVLLSVGGCAVGPGTPGRDGAAAMDHAFDRGTATSSSDGSASVNPEYAAWARFGPGSWARSHAEKTDGHPPLTSRLDIQYTLRDLTSESATVNMKCHSSVENQAGRAVTEDLDIASTLDKGIRFEK